MEQKKPVPVELDTVRIPFPGNAYPREFVTIHLNLNHPLLGSSPAEKTRQRFKLSRAVRNVLHTLFFGYQPKQAISKPTLPRR